jgi:hypothetical protein
MEWPAPPSGAVRLPRFRRRNGYGYCGPWGRGKNVCSVVGLDASGAVVMRRQVRRESLIRLSEKLLPCDRVVPFYDAHEVKFCRVLTDRGTEYCGNPEHHEYELYLALENIDHSRTKTKSPQTTDVIDQCFLAGSELFLSCARVTAWRRAGREAKALPRSLHRRTSFAAPVRARFGPRGFQPATNRA